MSSLEETMRSGIRVIGTVAVTLLALSACGAVDDTPTDNGTGKAGSPRSPSTTRSSGSSERPESQGRGDPFNLSAGDWPTDLRGADALYEKMPATFKIWPVTRVRSQPGTAGVFYKSKADAFSMEASNEIPDARDVLSAMFGMGMVCDPATYRGTATPMQGGQLPGLGSGKHPDPWWFACQAKGEGSRSYFTIGWTSGDVAWLLDAPDEDTSRELLDVMMALTH
jgi:hypothetical protein